MSPYSVSWHPPARGGNINTGHIEREFSFPAESTLPEGDGSFSRRVRSPYSTKREKMPDQNLDVTGVAMVPNVSLCRDEHLLLVTK